MMRHVPTYEETFAECNRWMWMRNIRPAPVQAGLLKVTGRSKRIIVVDSEGRRFFVDPFTNAGWQILRLGMYEPETVDLLRLVLREGHCFLDVGANEGIISAIAGTLVGEAGIVVSLEPQQRLWDLIEINCGLNSVRARLVDGALGGPAGRVTQINLYPSTNTGASGLMRRARFSWKRQATTFVAADSLLAESGRFRFDLVKVDVEGFEGEVVEALEELLRAGRVRHLLLDYHVQILEPRGLDAAVIHRRVIRTGMAVYQGEVTGGYVLYTHPSSHLA